MEFGEIGSDRLAGMIGPWSPRSSRPLPTPNAPMQADSRIVVLARYESFRGRIFPNIARIGRPPFHDL
jgi:hypothetical protein